MYTQLEDLRLEVCHLASQPRGPKPKYDEHQQLLFLKAYLTKQMSANELYEKFGVHRKQLSRWRIKFASRITHPGASHPGASAADPAADAIPTSTPPQIHPMPKKKVENTPVTQDDELSRLKTENKRLQDQLQMAQWMVHARDVMIEEAEKTFNIAIRKKSGAKQ